jgi:hypothetical protein
MNYLNKKLKSAVGIHLNYNDDSNVQVFMFDPNNLVHWFLKLELDFTLKEEEKNYLNYSQDLLEDRGLSPRSFGGEAPDLKLFRKIYIELKSKKYNGDKEQFWSLLEKIREKEISNFKNKYAICISTNILNIERDTLEEVQKKYKDNFIKTGDNGHLILQDESFIVVYLEFELSLPAFKPFVEEDEWEFVEKIKLDRNDFFKDFIPFYITITAIQLKKNPQPIDFYYDKDLYNVSFYNLKLIWYFFIYIILDYIPHMDIDGKSFTINNDEKKYIESIFISKNIDRIFYSKTTGSVDILEFITRNWLYNETSSYLGSVPFYHLMKTMFDRFGYQYEQIYNYILRIHFELLTGNETLNNGQIFFFIPITPTQNFMTAYMGRGLFKTTYMDIYELFIKNPITPLSIKPIRGWFLKILLSYGDFFDLKMLGMTTGITKEVIGKFISYKIYKIIKENKLYLNNRYCKSDFSLHLLDMENDKDKENINNFYVNAIQETESYSKVHGVQKKVHFSEDTFFRDFVVLVFDDKEQKIASIATFEIFPVKLDRDNGKLYMDFSYNKKLYYSNQKILTLNNLYTLNPYGSELLETTLEQKNYKKQFGEKLGMATLSSFIVFNICNLLKDDLNIIGAATMAASKGTKIIVSRFGFVDPTNFYMGKEVQSAKKSKVDYFREINRLNKEHDLYIENNLTNVTSKNIINYYKEKNIYQYWAKKMSDSLCNLNDSDVELLIFYINKIIKSIDDLHNKEKEILSDKEITKFSDYYYNLADYYQKIFHIRVILENRYDIILFFNEREYSRFERELERIKKIVKNCKAKLQKNEYPTFEEDESKKRIRNENEDVGSKRLRFTAKCSFCYKKNPKYTEKGNANINYFCDNKCQNEFYK